MQGIDGVVLTDVIGQTNNFNGALRGIALSNINGATVSNLDLGDVQRTYLSLGGVTNSTFSDFAVTGANSFGISISGGGGNVISGVDVSWGGANPSGEGVRFYASPDNTTTNLTVGNRSYGIRVFGVSPNNTFQCSSFVGNHYGMYFHALQGSPTTSVGLNRFEGNYYYGLLNAGSGILDAENNYWGAPDGPQGPGLLGSGDAVSANVDAEPFVADPQALGAPCGDNTAPIAEAGENQTVDEGTIVALDAGGSSDPDEDSLSFSWALISATGPSVTLSDPSAAAPTFAATDDGSYTFEVTVSDNRGGTDTAQVTVTVENVAPVAAAVGDAINEGLSATVSATFTDTGTQDTHTATVDWGDDTALETVTVSPGAGSGSLSASHTYGDNGTYAVIVTVTDDNTGADSDTVDVIVSNVAPTLTFDTGGAIDFLGGTAFIGRKDNEQTHRADGYDPGSDDLTFDWTFLGDPTAASNVYYNNGMSAEPNEPPTATPLGVYPFVIAGDSASVTFGAPGMYTVAVELTDDDGGADADSLDKIVTDDCDCTRSQGYWKQQVKERTKKDQKKVDKGTLIDEITLAAYLEIIRFASGIFDEDIALATMADANMIFSPPKGNRGGTGGGNSGSGGGQPTEANNDASVTGTKKKKGKNKDNDGSDTGSKKSKDKDQSGSGSGSGSNGESGSRSGTDPAKKREKATSQTLAAWLNFAYGAVDWDEMIDTNKDRTPDTAFGDLIAEVESILGNENATGDDLERAKDLAEAVNHHDKDNPDCDTKTGTGSK